MEAINYYYGYPRGGFESVIFEMGSFSYLVPSLLDAVPGSHSVQPVDPISVLIHTNIHTYIHTLFEQLPV